ncbi:uncharacterized protein BO88DRAFT_405264 [Aspergillus vadensis CBS 113365]|uniref:Uncharacterized protein n=1 Tax=Aspergillus vadensis (strain CBS 113365 / IMI 142717 / IBT 24658) TaxID=1448311 RepID=A0A319C0J6_ASPVC|nr:hypothetical protein BO88DRAFT_405264 [Aspergillus vadensis CBS 113365]PYH68958.1 hypothetical protein BO88DRAFT_405264 [Aspergillus vadensis CBS 113365]
MDCQRLDSNWACCVGGTGESLPKRISLSGTGKRGGGSQIHAARGPKLGGNENRRKGERVYPRERQARSREALGWKEAVVEFGSCR